MSTFYQTEQNAEYEEILYKINHRINKKINPCAYQFDDKITKHNIDTYNKEKIRKIKLSKNKNVLFNVYLWDVSFSSSYGFPNNSIGFNGQWMENKLAPFARYLTKINLNENVHVCYRKIIDTDEKSLNYLCDNLCMGNTDRMPYVGRRTSGDGEDNIITFNKHIKNKTDGGISFELFNYKHYCIEQNPIQYICPAYNKFYLNNDDTSSSMTTNCDITIDNYTDIDKELKYICNCSSYLYENNISNFETNCEKWIELINNLRQWFDTVGHEKPFWTMFLPENIKKFEEVRVLTDCGNFLHVVARSDNYFYFMQYTR